MKFSRDRRRSTGHPYGAVPAYAARRVEHYRRNPADPWTLTVVAAGETLALLELGGRLAIDDVYEGDDAAA